MAAEFIDLTDGDPRTLVERACSEWKAAAARVQQMQRDHEGSSSHERCLVELRAVAELTAAAVKLAVDLSLVNELRLARVEHAVFGSRLSELS